MLIRPLEIAVALILLLAASANLAQAKVFLSKNQALDLAFPGADRVEQANLYLTEAEMDRVAQRSGVRPDSAIYSFYVGKKGAEISGYATIEAATVRTLPETVLVVFNPDGTVRFTEILAFFEPEEYKPPQRWLDQFRGRSLSPALRVGGEIQGITGATLSAQAMARQVRKSSALLQILREKD